VFSKLLKNDLLEEGALRFGTGEEEEEIWGFEDLGIWGFEDLGIWGFEDLAILFEER
jgi:hypothetical protein